MAAKTVKRNKSKYIAMFIAAIIVVITGAVITFINHDLFVKKDDALSPDEYPFTVAMLDVGQGDGALIRCGEYSVMIDGGERQCAPAVLSYLERNGVEKIDCYILSHPHTDHIGAAVEIIESFPVEKVIMTNFSEMNIPTTKTYENLIDAIAGSSAVVEMVKAGDKLTYGELNIDILSPFVETDDYNDMSIVMTAEYKDITVLFTGDASKDIEKQILESGENIKADILKVGHHGSSTATSREFVKEVNPSYAVISCGIDNKYGHPHKETLETLGRFPVEVLRTDESGNILFYSDGKSLNYEVNR